MNTMTTKLSGEYMIEIKRADGSVDSTGWFKNLILDSGLNLLGSASEPTNFARVGTGSSTPVVTQTTLDAQVAASPRIYSYTSRVNSGAPLYQTLYTFTYAFAQGAVVGNITEVGVGWQATGATLFSRALILDNGGNPTTLTLTSIDQLTVYYRLNLAPSLSDTTGSVTLGSTVYNYTCRVSDVANFGNYSLIFNTGSDGFSNAYPNIYVYPAGSALGPVTGNPTGSGTYMTASVSSATYSPGNFYRNSTWTFGPSVANLAGGVQAIKFVWGNNGYFFYQIVFDTPIPKVNTNTLTLQMRFIWGRA